MIQTKSLPGMGRGLVLVGGVTVMGVSLALAQLAAQSQARAQVRQPEQPAAGQRQPLDRPGEAARQPGERQPTERKPAERRPAERRPGEQPIEPADDRRGPQDDDARRERPEGLGFKVEGEGDKGLIVSSVEREGMAGRAGLRTNDKIVSVDGRPLRNSRQLMAYLSGQDGRRVPVVVERDGKQMTIQLMTTPANSDGAWLGIFLEQGEEGRKGATITQVYPAGPAARAGLRSGDVILAVNGEECLECAGLIETLEKQKAGEKIQLTVQRGDQQIKVDAKLANRNQFVFSGPRDLEPGQADQWSDSHEHDDFFDIPEYAMELEAHRRLAEQHERIENLIQQLRGEVQALREELKAKR
jgi:hypothetical protein